LVEDRKHQNMLRFIRKAVDVAGGYSKEDLVAFRNQAVRNYPLLVPLIDDYLRLAEESDTDSFPSSGLLFPLNSKKQKSGAKSDASNMHLFDLLRSKKLFPSNSILADFAARIMPNMRVYRFDKMSRADIAGRIIEYLEDRDPRTREELESSMREAMLTPAPRNTDRKSFLSKWEKIIKGIPL
jgi:hypothetical protein